MKRLFGTMLLLLIVAVGYAKGPKYIFYFIGDGMGPSHVLGTELYLGELQGVIGRPQKLCFTQFPESAFVTTYSVTNGVTDSAASGTALSTGHKTYNAAIGVGKDSLNVYSVAADLSAKGMAIGVATTVPINHATPAAFYAHNVSRHNYDSIAPWMLRAGYDFYAGGDVKGSNETRSMVYGNAEKMGYTISRGYNDFCNKAGSAQKMMLFQENVATELPYAINRTEKDLTLAQITAAGIDFLEEKSKKGFFMMIEGGKIDYAAHNDDGATVFQEVLDFDAAVAVAYEFYKKHKDETLIIVTADHETGGLVLGYRGDYTLNLKALSSQKVSVERMIEILQAEKETTWERLEQLVKENIGVGIRNKKANGERVTVDYDLAREIAYNAVYDLNRSAALSWASGNHSGTFVPLFAIGKGADMFNGVIDNTDIPKIIRQLKGVK
ncbi:MAG: alkaline phosphatase [Bacteroidaceae bacterium]|nr:alkaline phosphatase [Bacteroidaceae bacterium]